MVAGNEHTAQHRPFALIGLAVTGVLTGAVLGALTNSINGWVSPLYFCNILGWDDVGDVWRASIAQGIFEGLLFGFFLAIVFTIVVGCVSKSRCSYRFGVGTLISNLNWFTFTVPGGQTALPATDTPIVFSLVTTVSALSINGSLLTACIVNSNQNAFIDVSDTTPTQRFATTITTEVYGYGL